MDKIVTLTRAQRVALKRVYDRQPIGQTYRQFRRTVQPELCGPAVMVFWCNMWIGIERDGHAHS
jgi:hypothetical protein